ncbi:hypothetical protein [Methylobacterium sp. Leaf89]|uniref:hypothetical protein n=1 Tax=Methylobacterium sp. Leaf89 TaxID=1736245 RepID=UPI0007018F7C|nr:hypothetical protein [Methylobacterium sp. Leaf89]KQO71909.1 hypothetical protein ASF18_20205 [Methylobacterium sp. Leaf89]
MTITVPLMQVGIIRATEIVHGARNDAARRHEAEPRTVSVEVGRARDAEGDVVGRQRRIVDVRV